MGRMKKSFIGEPIQLTNEQYSRLMNSINNAIANPPDYNVFGSSFSETGNNCTGWAVSVWNEARLPNQFGVTNKWVWNPYGQAMSQFTKNIAGDVIGGIISATNLDEWKKNFQEMSKLIVVFDQFKNKSIETVKQQVDSAKSTSSPIVLDLNSNGIDTTGVKEGAYFDHASDGFAEQTGWINPSDALLVRDLNNNGYIDNGSELFGNETFINGVKAANGFEALKALDSNHDSQITSQDTDFGSLKLWIDTNGDGFSQNNELHTLAEEGVVSISTSYQNSTFVEMAMAMPIGKSAVIPKRMGLKPSPKTFGLLLTIFIV